MIRPIIRSSSLPNSNARAGDAGVFYVASHYRPYPHLRPETATQDDLHERRFDSTLMLFGSAAHEPDRRGDYPTVMVVDRLAEALQAVREELVTRKR